jgi:TolB-like protein
MPERPLIERVKHARIGQVMVVYAGASWVILQLVDVIQDMLPLPSAVGPITIILLAVGALVVSATAWVQSLASTTAAEQAGEVPTDWEVAPGDAVQSLMAGKLPHLTWGRAIAGGVFALSMVFGGAGLYVLLAGGEGIIGATPAEAGELADGIAVMPFNVSGDDFELYREGMVDLLSANVDGVGGFRTIDSRTVLARWDEEVGDVGRPDLRTTLRVAARTQARYAVLGSLVPAGSQVRLDVEIYDLADASELGSARVEGSPDDILALIDELSVGIARELLGTSEPDFRPDRIESITTSSVEALEHYLEGEQLQRRADFDGAHRAYERAVAVDSTFALAWVGMGQVRGWSPLTLGSALEARRVAMQYVDRLSDREATVLQAWLHFGQREPEGITLLEDFVRRHPDVAEAWVVLSEFPMHRRSATPAPRDSVYALARKAAELEPGFAPHYLHLVPLAAGLNDSIAAGEWAAAYSAAGGGTETGPAAGWYQLDLYFGANRTQEEIAATARTAQPMGSVIPTDRWGRLLPIFRALEQATSNSLVGSRGAVAGGYAIATLNAGALREFEAFATDAVPGWSPTARVALRISSQRAHGRDSDDSIHEAVAALDCNSDAACADLEVQRVRHAALAEPNGEAEQAFVELDRLLASARSSGSPDTVRMADKATGARAIWLLASGDPGGAYALWESVRGRRDFRPFEAALAADGAGQLESAEWLYRVSSDWGAETAFATRRLADLYERTGRPTEALREYRRLLLMWEFADTDLPQLAEVQVAVARLEAAAP